MSQKVIVVGAGTMGASLAQVYAQAEWNTVLYNRSEPGLERARKLIAINQETLVSEGLQTVEGARHVQDVIQMTTDKAAFADADLVVENIVEDLVAKKTFWAEISALVPTTALLATNTSGLHISDIAEAVVLPERFIGQHWFNPPHLIPLCELVMGEKTSQETVETMRKLVLNLGKSPIVVKKDISGFVANRLQFAMLREALYIVNNGVSTYEDVDTVLKAGLGLRYAALGPFGVTDFGGLDTFSHISDYLFSDLCNDKEGSAVMRNLVAEGKCGVKSGAGFYDYTGDKAQEAIRHRDKIYIDLAKTLYFKEK